MKRSLSLVLCLWLTLPGVMTAQAINPCLDPATPDSSVWFQADYLLWFITRQPLPHPLVTQGTGALNAADTRVLFGGNPVDMGVFSGARFGLGMWIDHEHLWGIEASGFFLGANTARFAAQSDAEGSPPLGQPAFIPGYGEDSFLLSLPGIFYGRITTEMATRLYGWEVNVVRNFVREDGWQVDGLLGYRQLRFTENLTMKSSIRSIEPGFLTFAGAPIPANAGLLTTDYFGTGNDVYAPQIGGRCAFAVDRFSAEVIGKVGLGVVRQNVDILGNSIYVPRFPDTNGAMANGGLYALDTNIPGGSTSRFVVVPEVSARVSYEIIDGVRLSVGYGFLYISDVARPGNQLDRVINPNYVPTDAEYGRYPGPARPAFQMHHSSIWAHGINIGTEIRF